MDRQLAPPSMACSAGHGFAGGPVAGSRGIAGKRGGWHRGGRPRAGRYVAALAALLFLTWGGVLQAETKAGTEPGPAATGSGGAGLPPVGTEQQMLEQQRILESARKALELRFRTLDQSFAALSDHVDNHKLVPQDAATRLVGIYEAMRPREAAAVFNVMDPHVLIAIAASMNIRKLSAVMAHMTPDRVNLVSQYLVGVRHFHHAVLSVPVMVPVGSPPSSAGQGTASEAEALERLQGGSTGDHGPLLPSRQ